MPRPDRRKQIMQAAEKLFTTRRFHEITLDDVVREARVGKGTIYRYFRDKDDLFFQTATAGFDELCVVVRNGAPLDRSFQEQILGVCRRISEFFQRRRQWFRMMQTEDGRMVLCAGPLHERWHAHRRQLVAAVAEVLGRGVAEGAVRGDIPPDALACYLLGMLRARAHDLADAPQRVGSHETLVDLFCRGAGAHGKTPKPTRKGKSS
jgi:AcrR family transcriptional regulator